MFERYTEAARRAVYFARAEALHRGARQIETSDLVLGIARGAEEGWQNDLNVRFEEVRALFGAGPAQFSMPKAKDIALTDDSKRSLAYAAVEGERTAIGLEQMLRGVLRNGDATAVKLKEAGIEFVFCRENASVMGRVRYVGRRVRRGGRTWVKLLVFGIVVGLAVLYLRSQN